MELDSDDEKEQAEVSAYLLGETETASEMASETALDSPLFTTVREHYASFPDGCQA